MKKRVGIIKLVFLVTMLVLSARLTYICVIKHNYYYEKARDVQERSRRIKAPRGIIYDRNGLVLADNKTVYSISVVHNQITDMDKVVSALSKILEIDEEEVRKKTEKKSIREIIKVNVPEAKAKQLEEMDLAGVKIDSDSKRYYPYGSLASKVIGFTGADNQGILGLEVHYDDVLTGIPGSINTVTTARGVEIDNLPERRVEGEAGCNLVTTIDLKLQQYAEETAKRVMEQHKANRVCIIMMNPQNGEIYAMTDTPEYDLNDPFTINNVVNEETTQDKDEAVSANANSNIATAGDANKNSELDLMEARNRMWRCFCISDTYEPGSIFKIVTATSALEDKVVSLTDTFFCPGYRLVADRRIKCHKVIGHGSETFKDGLLNSCNPVFIEVGMRVGAKSFYEHVKKLGLLDKTGIDMPGEANSIFHKLENVGPLELATMSFGQSIQITPIQLLRAASAIVNGGTLVTPHFGKYITDKDNNIIKKLDYPENKGALSEETSETMRTLLRAVVAEGSGNKAYAEGFDIGGKTATSEKLPRGTGKYISSFMGFAPADNPQIITLILIDEPEGVYYGGTIAAPVVGEMYKNILPYLGIKKGDIGDEI